MRHLELFIDSCGKCPWCRYETEGKHNISAWYCEHEKSAEDNLIVTASRFEIRGSFPPIPKWCPLPYENLA